MARGIWRELLRFSLFLAAGFLMWVVLDYLPNYVGWVGLVSIEYGGDAVLRELVVSRPPIENSLELILNSTLASIYSLGVLDVNNTRLAEAVGRGLEDLGVVIGHSTVTSVETAPALEGKIPLDKKPMDSVGYVYFSDRSYLYVSVIRVGSLVLFHTFMFLVTNLLLMAGVLGELVSSVFLRLFLLGIFLLVQSFPLIYYSRLEFPLTFNLITIYFFLVIAPLFVSFLRRAWREGFRRVFELTLIFLLLVVAFALGALDPVLRIVSIKRLGLELILGTSNLIMTLAVVFLLIILQLGKRRALYAEVVMRAIYGVLSVLILFFYYVFFLSPLCKAIKAATYALILPHASMLLLGAVFIVLVFKQLYHELCRLTRECKPKDYLVAK